MADIGKYEPLTDVFVNYQLLKFCQNTRTQYTSTNIHIPDSDHFLSTQDEHVDRILVNVILQKDMRGLFRNWSQHDIDLRTTMLQMSRLTNNNTSMVWVVMV